MNKRKYPITTAFAPSVLPLAAFLALIAYNLAFTSNFGLIEIKDGRLFGTIIDIFHRAVPVILLALGMTLVMATRGIDLSVGAVMAIAGAIAAILLANTTISVPSVVLISLAAAVVCGLWNGVLVAYLRIQPIVATLVLMVAGRGIAQLMTDGQIIPVKNGAFAFIGNGSLMMLPFTIFIAAGVALFTYFITRKTVAGPYIEAVGGNETASVLSGINAISVKLFVYAFCGLCAGIAGLIATADIKAADVSQVGLNLELDAILAVVIGGTLFTGGRFSLLGSIVGALIIQTLTTTILMNVGVEYTLVVKAVAVILVCVIQSQAFKERLSLRGRLAR